MASPISVKFVICGRCDTASIQSIIIVVAYASERLKNDMDIAKIAFISDSEAFDKEPLIKYRGAIVKDREFVKEYLIKSNFPVLPSEYEDDDEIALIAVKADGSNYRLLSDRLKNEKTLAKVAVQNDGYCMEYAPDCIKNDWSFIKELILQCSAPHG